jgi:uncharacterized phage protein (TIGR02216 family)
VSRAQQGFDFESALGFGMCVLGLAPRDVWAASPNEIAAAVRFLTGPSQGLSRAELDRLMARFPDRRPLDHDTKTAGGSADRQGHA